MWGLAKAREKDPRRKFTEWLMSIALERRLSKDKVLELYLNDVALGQRGSFAIHGVPEAARLFFGKDVSNLSLVEAATIAGVIQAPSPALARSTTRTAPKSAATSCSRRWPTPASSARTPPSARRASRCRSWRARSSPKRRTSSTTCTQELAGAHEGRRRGRRLHDARSAPAAHRAGRGPRRADPRRRDARRSGGRASRRRR